MGMEFFNQLSSLLGLSTAVLIPVFVFIVLLIFAIPTAIVAHKKGRNAFGWFTLGLLTGPVGLAIILVALPIHYYIKSGDDDL